MVEFYRETGNRLDIYGGCGMWRKGVWISGKEKSSLDAEKTVFHSMLTNTGVIHCLWWKELKEEETYKKMNHALDFTGVTEYN